MHSISAPAAAYERYAPPDTAARDDLSAALDSVVARFGDLMHRTARRHGLSPADADEVVQNVRIRLWHALVTSEKVRHVPASYVYRAAVPAALDLIRRRRRRREDSLEALAECSDTASGATRRGADTPDAALDDEELGEAVARAVDRLGASRRPVVRMYLAGYGREEIAALLGWSEPKTRNLLYRGLGDLRETLRDWGIGPEDRQWTTRDSASSTSAACGGVTRATAARPSGRRISSN